MEVLEFAVPLPPPPPPPPSMVAARRGDNPRGGFDNVDDSASRGEVRNVKDSVDASTAAVIAAGATTALGAVPGNIDSHNKNKSGASGIVGTITMLGGQSAMIWFGWGSVVETTIPVNTATSEGKEDNCGKDNKTTASMIGQCKSVIY